MSQQYLSNAISQQELEDDQAYTHYELDNQGQVIEHYDHTHGNSGNSVSQHDEIPPKQTRFINPNLISNINNIPSENGFSSSAYPGPSGNFASQPLLQNPSTTLMVPIQTTQPMQQPSPNNVNPSTISQQPIIVLDEHRKRESNGCCGTCAGCCSACNRMPCCSIFAFLLVLLGTGLTCACGWLVMQNSFNLWEDYGPPKGNPVFDPEPIWIKNVHSNVGFDWVQVNPQYRPGNYLPWVREGLEYFIIAWAPFSFIMALLMLVVSYTGAREIHQRSTYTAWRNISETTVCCSMFLTVVSFIILMFYVIWSCFAGLALYYYRMVYERCWNLNDQGFDPGIQKNICLDLVQLGVVRYVPVVDQGYGLLCGPGNNVQDVKIYGDLEGYCDNYFPTYLLTIAAFTGGPVCIMGLAIFLMVLHSNYSIITGRYIKKFVKMDAKTIVEPNRNRTPSNMNSTQVTYAPPNNFSQTNFSVASKNVRKVPKVTGDLKNYYRN